MVTVNRVVMGWGTCKRPHLDVEVSQVQLTEDLAHDAQALCVGDHGVVVARYVEVLRRHNISHTSEMHSAL